MDTTKFLLASLAGGVTLFLLAWIIYGMLLMGFYEANSGLTAEVQEQVSRGDNMVWWALALGNIVSAALYAYVFEKWAGIRTFQSGAKGGAVIGFITALGMNLTFYGTSHLSNFTATLVDSILWIVIGGIVGGVVGWVLGMGRGE